MLAEILLEGAEISLSISVMTGIQLFFAVGMLAFDLPKRGGFAARAAVAAALLVFALDALSALGMAFVAKDSLSLNFFARFATFSLSVTLLCALVRMCFRATFWAALFCASTGYTVQNIAAGLQSQLELTLTPGMGGFAQTWAGSWLFAIGCGVTVFLAVYLLFSRYVDVNDLVLGERRKMAFAVFLVICVNIAFDIVIRQLEHGVVTMFQMSVLRFTHFAVSLLIFFLESEFLNNKRLAEQVGAVERLRAEEERQWRLQEANVEAINLKCHDIRHQIRQLGSSGTVIDAGVLESISREIDIYDSGVKTGNNALDVILSEKGLICEREQIRLACVVDGTALGFMAPADLYSLFGNALDNAISAVKELPDQALRLVSLSVSSRMGMASIHIENRYSGAVRFKDGLPQTSKPDAANHGFGTRSMRAVVERYGGVISMDAEDGVFSLNVAIPLPR